MHQDRLAATQLEGRLAEKDHVGPGGPAKHESAMQPHEQRPTAWWAALGRVLQAGQGR